MRKSCLMTVILGASLIFAGCTIQRAPGAYAVAKGKKEPAKEEVEQPVKPDETALAKAEAQPVHPVEEEAKIVFEAEALETVRVVEPEVIEPVAVKEPVDTAKKVKPEPVPVVEEKEVTRAEQFTVVEAQPENPLKDYNVVIGSFGRKENADGLKLRMTTAGYKPVIVINDKGMYRVILSSFDTYREAKSLINSIKGDFADAWVLVQK